MMFFSEFLFFSVHLFRIFGATTIPQALQLKNKVKRPALEKECESEVAQSCPTLCNPMDCSLPGSSIHGVFQASITRMGCRFLLQGKLPDPGIKPKSPAL